MGQQSTKSQGPDYIAFVSPSVGFGGGVGVELGLPIGVYGEDLTGNSDGCVTEPCFAWERPENQTTLFALPYVKLGLGQEQANRIAAALSVGAVALIYSRDFGTWEPYLSVKRLFPGGDPRFDDVPRQVSRFQESDQTIWGFATGVERRGPTALGIELGMVSNRYAGSPTQHDVFVGAKVMRE